MGMGQVKTVSDADSAWLTLQKAARQAGCSVKTLYRLMDRGHLEYRKGGDNRRYVREERIRELFPMLSVGKTMDCDLDAELQNLRREVQKLANQLEMQTTVLKGLITLYQPRDLQSLMAKHWPESSDPQKNGGDETAFEE
ncbi:MULTISPECIES: helix-turn-helix domain-containing protein [unclassified Ectothiorhodospira]|uniref:helix-turn-helix domain-containing protein n=1 Tax=unclassified Ectothiorhodospira TaxID=2684909 RepID=UPI001EE7BA0B|nr:MULTISPECIES: helix-turn-helix domain-containing protein [unclassified Ectothiorhodospira]MCG5517348.1 helix-turn-helix domain-containing protein [Ectothiorhodospira sp. 9100]MCG5519948.1 helix-turn-helix domain-containing protein [Ectothiorhodospira sp. 9905]